MYEPSKTSLNWANRAPGRAPVETRDDILLAIVDGDRFYKRWQLYDQWEEVS